MSTQGLGAVTSLARLDVEINQQSTSKYHGECPKSFSRFSDQRFFYLILELEPRVSSFNCVVTFFNAARTCGNVKFHLRRGHCEQCHFNWKLQKFPCPGTGTCCLRTMPQGRARMSPRRPRENQRTQKRLPSAHTPPPPQDHSHTHVDGSDVGPVLCREKNSHQDRCLALLAMKTNYSLFSSLVYRRTREQPQDDHENMFRSS